MIDEKAALVLLCHKILSGLNVPDNRDNLESWIVLDQAEQGGWRFFIERCMELLRAGGPCLRCITVFPAYSVRTVWDEAAGATFECSVISTVARVKVAWDHWDRLQTGAALC